MEYFVAIRELVEQALIDDQLKNLLFDNFRPVYDNTEGQSRSAKIRDLVDYAQRQYEVHKLLDAVQKCNPKAYEKFQYKPLDNEVRIFDLKKKRKDLLKSISRDKSMEDIDKEIRAIDLEIENLQKGNLLNFRKLWDDKLSEIDFQKAKRIVENLKQNCLTQIDKRYAILLLDNMIAMEGVLMLRWLENYLRCIGCWTDPFVYKPSIVANKDEFIRKLALRYDVSIDADISRIIAKLRVNFCAGDYFLIKIEIPELDKSASDFLLWFVQEFWQQFTQCLDSSYAVVTAISIDCQLDEQYLPDNVICNGTKFDGQKIKRLPFQDWKRDDIQLWLRDHSGLGTRGCDMSKFTEAATGLIKNYKGKPISTRNALSKKLEQLFAETETTQMDERA
jgi:hypothetical protein